MKLYNKNEDKFAETFQTMARNAAAAVWYGKWEQAEMLLSKMLEAVRSKLGNAA